MADLLTEQMFGEGAFRAVGKFIVHGGKGEGANLFAGSIIGAPEGANDQHQMWECEIIVIPHRKFTDVGYFRGYRIDQILTSNFSDRQRWGNKDSIEGVPYWEKAGEKELDTNEKSGSR